MISRVAVVIPAANEEDEIAGCLASVRTARQHLAAAGMAVTSTQVIVVLDNCRDRTAQRLRRFEDVRVLECSAGSVGGARRAGTAVALASARGPADELLLVNTDADCRVPSNWLVAILREARLGAELILGTVRPAAGLPATLEQAWYAAHQLRDDHPHIHGANLAITGDLYTRIGGWRQLTAHEDVDLVARGSGARVRRSDSFPVITSVRKLGRTPVGFAAYLRQLAMPPNDSRSSSAVEGIEEAVAEC